MTFGPPRGMLHSEILASFELSGPRSASARKTVLVALMTIDRAWMRNAELSYKDAVAEHSARSASSGNASRSH